MAAAKYRTAEDYAAGVARARQAFSDACDKLRAAQEAYIQTYANLAIAMNALTADFEAARRRPHAYPRHEFLA